MAVFGPVLFEFGPAELPLSLLGRLACQTCHTRTTERTEHHDSFDHKECVTSWSHTVVIP